MSAKFENTVFISYRRAVTAFHARAVFMALRDRGLDVFMDVESIDSGEFAGILINQVAARAHFIILLAPGTLDACSSEEDWVRREIETALSTERNIVPVVLSDFSLGDRSKFPTETLAQLANYTAVTMHHEYFYDAIDKLCSRFLKLPEQGTIPALETRELQMVEEAISSITEQPRPTEVELQTEEIFVRGYQKRAHGDLAGAVADFTEAIALDASFFRAYHERGMTFLAQGKPDEAIVDFTQTTTHKPGYLKAYYNRGLVFLDKEDYASAISDFTETIRLNPRHADAYNNRGVARRAERDLRGAVSDFSQAIKLDPANASFYYNRGLTHHELDNKPLALEDYKQSIALSDEPNDDIRKRIRALEAPDKPGPLLRFAARMLGLPPSPGEVLQPLEEIESLAGDYEAGTRPLPMIEKTGPIHMMFGQLSHADGMPDVRSDILLSSLLANSGSGDLPDIGVFLVASGTGARGENDQAARLAARTVSERLFDVLYIQRWEDTRDDGGDRPHITGILRDAVEAANRVLHEQNEGGAAITAVVVAGDLAHVAHVGNNRAYLVYENQIELITRDHTVVQRLIELGSLPPEQAAEHPQREILYRALGQSESIETDTFTRRLAPGTCLLLSGCGLSKAVPDDQMLDIVTQHDSPQTTCETLVALALKQGGLHNLAATLVKIV